MTEYLSAKLAEAAEYARELEHALGVLREQLEGDIEGDPALMAAALRHVRSAVSEWSKEQDSLVFPDIAKTAEAEEVAPSVLMARWLEVAKATVDGWRWNDTDTEDESLLAQTSYALSQSVFCLQHFNKKGGLQ